MRRPTSGTFEPATGQVLNVERGEDGYVVWAVLDEPSPEDDDGANPAAKPSAGEPADRTGSPLGYRPGRRPGCGRGRRGPPPSRSPCPARR